MSEETDPEMREAIDGLRGTVGELGERLSDLQQTPAPPAMSSETHEALLRIERMLHDTQVAITAVGARIPEVDGRAISDVLDGLSFVATKVDALTRTQPTTSTDAATTRDEGLASSLHARIEELAHQLHDDAMSSVKNVQGWAQDFRETSTALLAGVESIRTSIERAADPGAIVQELEAARSATEAIRAGVASLTASITEVSERSSGGFGDVRERLGQTTDQIVAAMDVLSGVVGSTRTEMPSVVAAATTRAQEAIVHEITELKGPFLVMGQRLDAALARTEALEEERASLARLIERVQASIAEVGGRADELSSVVGPGFEDLRQRVGGFQGEMRAAFTALRDDVSATIHGSVETLAPHLEATSTSVGEAVRFLHEALTASQAHLERFREEIGQGLIDQRDAQTRALSAQLDTLAALLEQQRSGVDQALSEALRAQQSTLDETSGAMSTTVTRATADLTQELQAGLTLLRGEVERARTETTSTLDATTAELASQMAAARDEIRTSVAGFSAIATALPDEIRPAAEGLLHVAQTIARAVDETVAGVRQGADDGIARVIETLDTAALRSQEELGALSEAVRSAVGRIDAQEQTVAAELARLTDAFPQIGEETKAAIASVTGVSLSLERRAADLVALAGDGLAQFADELTTSLGVARGEMEGWVSSAFAEVDGRLAGAFDAFDGRVDRGITDLTSRVEVGLGELIAQLDGRVSDLTAYIASAVDDVTAQIDQRAESGAVESNATLEALSLRLDALAADFGARADAMQASIAGGMQTLAEQTGARIDELVASVTARVDASLAAIPTTEEVSAVLHERAAGALRGVRRRLVRMDDVMTTLTGAEAGMRALAARVASLEDGVRALPSATDVAEVLLSSKRRRKRRAAAARPVAQILPEERASIPSDIAAPVGGPVRIVEEQPAHEAELDVDEDFPEAVPPATASSEADPDGVLALEDLDGSAEDLSSEDIEFLDDAVRESAAPRSGSARAQTPRTKVVAPKKSPTSPRKKPVARKKPASKAAGDAGAGTKRSKKKLR